MGQITDPYDPNALNLVALPPGAFTSGSWDALNELSFQGGGSNAPSFQWNNPYKFTPFGAGAAPGASFGSKLGGFVGNNMPLIGAGFNLLTSGLQAYTGLKGLSLAKDALKQQKREYNINLTNQTQAYNTEIGDRIAGRHYNTEAERQAALAAAQLLDRSTYGKGG